MKDFFSKAVDLKNRAIFTVLLLIIYRLGTYIPLPGVNINALRDLFTDNNLGFLGMFNVFSGGALGRMTIFALNIMPYILASIILQLLIVALKNDFKFYAELERKKINFYNKLLTILICILQANFILFGLGKAASSLTSNNWIMYIVALITLVGSTFLLIWIGEQINNKGIGNGISLIIFTGIVAELPTAFASLANLIKVGAYSPLILVGIFIMFALLLYLIILCERSYRCIPIYYPRRQVGNKLYNSASLYIPIKLNISGVIPPIFANAILLLPFTLASLNKESAFSNFILENFSIGQPIYILTYSILIVFFCFFYSTFVFNTDEVAGNLKKNGAIISGRRPGKLTAEYLSYIARRVTCIGSLYLALICIIPEIFRSYYYIPFIVGGTSLLIIVNVVIDTISQVQSYLLSFQYDNLLKKTSHWGGR